MTVKQLIKENKGTILDVRSIGEYQGGHVAGSKNIPLGEVPNKIEELKAMESPLILCCASGGRSGQATSYLSANGLECVNGGSWLDINYHQADCVSN